MRSEFDDPSFRWKEKGSRLQPLGHLEPIGQVHKVSRWAGGLARAFSSLLDLICYIGSGPKHRNRVCVCVSLSLSFCLSVRLSCLTRWWCTWRWWGTYVWSVYLSSRLMYICTYVCVCARRSFNSQTPERIQRFAVRVPIGLKIKTTLE